jgi:hypothetical protein
MKISKELLKKLIKEELDSSDPIRDIERELSKPPAVNLDPPPKQPKTTLEEIEMRAIQIESMTFTLKDLKRIREMAREIKALVKTL